VGSLVTTSSGRNPTGVAMPVDTMDLSLMRKMARRLISLKC
jgi:hypothetical protein